MDVGLEPVEAWGIVLGLVESEERGKVLEKELIDCRIRRMEPFLMEVKLADLNLQD